MGKRKDKEDESSEDRRDLASPHKKAKHKHKKHKRKRERTSSNSEEIDVVGLDQKKESAVGFPSLKLKIKFGGEIVSTAQVINIDKNQDATLHSHVPRHSPVKSVLQVPTQTAVERNQEILTEEISETEEVDDLVEEFEDDEEEYAELEEEEIQDISIENTNEEDSQQGANSEEDIDDSDDEGSRQMIEDPRLDGPSQESAAPQKKEKVDEETKWLDALEAGELDDMGRLKRELDVSLMTTRQRALYGHIVEGETQLIELPTLAKRRDEDSEEAQLRRKQRAKKRKQQMQKQIEENKAQTIDKLLNKQAAKLKKEAKARHKKRQGAHIKYLNGRDFISMSLSKGIEFPMNAQAPREPPLAKKCAVEGCENNKKYSCSKTKLPVCGLSCYQRIQQLNLHAQPVG